MSGEERTVEVPAHYVERLLALDPATDDGGRDAERIAYELKGYLRAELGLIRSEVPR